MVVILSIELENDCLQEIREVTAETHITRRRMRLRRGSIRKAVRIVETEEDITIITIPIQENEVIQVVTLGAVRIARRDVIITITTVIKNIITTITIIRSMISMIIMANMRKKIKKRDLNREAGHPVDVEATIKKSAVVIGLIRLSHFILDIYVSLSIYSLRFIFIFLMSHKFVEKGSEVKSHHC